MVLSSLYIHRLRFSKMTLEMTDFRSEVSSFGSQWVVANFANFNPNEWFNPVG